MAKVNVLEAVRRFRSRMVRNIERGEKALAEGEGLATLDEVVPPREG